MSISRGSNLDDANDDGRKCQDRTDRPKNDGNRERVQGVCVRGRGRAGSVDGMGRASGRPEVRAKHNGEVK
jgi:hypothetical protein